MSNAGTASRGRPSRRPDSSACKPRTDAARSLRLQDVLSTVVGVLRHVSQAREGSAPDVITGLLDLRQEHHEKPPQRDVGIACRWVGVGDSCTFSAGPS